MGTSMIKYRLPFKKVRKFCVSSFSIAQHYWKLKQRRYKYNTTCLKNKEVDPYVKEMKKTGYVVIPNYYSSQDCEVLRLEIEKIIQRQPQVVKSDALNADNRVFGSERASKEIYKFHADTFLQNIGEAYFDGVLTNYQTLAGRLNNVPNNLGSGQGWHRDSFGFQFKAIIYLSDVEEKQGPFQIIEKSHHFSSIILDTLRGDLPLPPESRFSDMQIRNLLATEAARLKTIVGRAGTVILVDTSCIHRGMPILQGSRYALTNYYYAPYQIEENLIKKFRPLASNLERE